jgi:hypothetical protein
MQAFLFSLHSPSGVGPVKLSLVQDYQRWSFAIMSDSTYGPAFGGGCQVSPDLWINGTGGNSSLGNTYQVPPGQSAHFFTGDCNFQAAELELYQVQLQS